MLLSVLCSLLLVTYNDLVEMWYFLCQLLVLSGSSLVKDLLLYGILWMEGANSVGGGVPDGYTRGVGYSGGDTSKTPHILYRSVIIIQATRNTRKLNVPSSKFEIPNITALQLWKIETKEHISIIIREIKNADVIIFNQGLHQNNLCGGAMHLYLNDRGHLLQQETQGTSKQVIIRSTVSQHFITESGDGFWEDRIKTSKKCVIVNPNSHYSNHYLQEMARKYNFKYLDNFPLFYERGDMVKGWNGKEADCAHYCFSPEIILPELVLLTELIQI